jgi:hypothetical protein
MLLCKVFSFHFHGCSNFLSLSLSSIETVITPAVGAATIAGVAPGSVVGTAITPSAGGLSVVGQVPGIARAVVITPSTGALVVVGSRPTVNNPNWSNIDDAQTPNWLPVAA